MSDVHSVPDRFHGFALNASLDEVDFAAAVAGDLVHHTGINAAGEGITPPGLRPAGRYYKVTMKLTANNNSITLLQLPLSPCNLQNST